VRKSINQKLAAAESLSPSDSKPVSDQIGATSLRRRSFLKGLGATSALLLPASAMMINKAQAQSDDSGGNLTAGDASILRFLCTAEIIESDFWEQYWELGSGVDDFASTNPATGKTPTPTGGNPAYMTSLGILDSDMPQYILDNTDDEFSHANFLLAYLKSKGANTSDLDLLVGPHFRTLTKTSSTAKGSTK
jgi:hypothetical protein